MTYLYRLFAADGKLLYVGITDDLNQRLAAHSWRGFARFTSEAYPTRESAEAAEARAILIEKPAQNRQQPALRPAPEPRPVVTADFEAAVARLVAPSSRASARKSLTSVCWCASRRC
jgi:hypothetical protein